MPMIVPLKEPIESWQSSTIRTLIPEMKVPQRNSGKLRKPMRYCPIRKRERPMIPMAMRPLMRIPLREQAPVLAVLISAAWIWEIFSPSFSGEASVPPTVLPAEDPICRKREPIFV